MTRYLSPATRLYLRDRVIRWAFLYELTALVATVVTLGVAFPRGSTVPLHYNVSFGIDFVGPWTAMFSLVGVMVGLGVMNGVVGHWIWRRDRVLSYALVLGGSVAVTVLLVAVGLITFMSATYAE